MLDQIVNFLKGAFGEAAVMRWGLVCVIVLVVVAIYVFFVKELSNTFDKYYEFKLAKCADAALTAAQLSNTDNETVLRSALKRFDELYYGELVLFEGNDLEAQMVRLRRLLVGEGNNLNDALHYEDVRPRINAKPGEYKSATLDLAAACRREVAPSLLNGIIDRLTWTRSKYR